MQMLEQMRREDLEKRILEWGTKKWVEEMIKKNPT